jgi:hypothetical protein
MLGSAVQVIGAVPTDGWPGPSHNAHSMSFAAVVLKLGETIFPTYPEKEALVKVSTGDAATLEYSTTDSPTFTLLLKVTVIV